MGKRPHLARHLREKILVAPLGDECVANLGSFFVVVSDRAQRDAANAFVDWLHAEAQKDVDGPAT